MEFKIGDIIKSNKWHGDRLLVIQDIRPGPNGVPNGVMMIDARFLDDGLKSYPDLYSTQIQFAYNPTTEKAKKDDSNKPRMDILFRIRGLDIVADVFTSGGKKYGDDYNWRKAAGSDSDKFQSRLLAAAMRHLYKWACGQKLDEQSGKSHLAHACANILMMLDLEEK